MTLAYKRNPKKQAPQSIIKNDGWVNIFTGLGGRADPNRALPSGNYERDPFLSRHTLESIFVGDGIGRRIVEMPAEEAIRPWVTVEGDQGGEILDVLEDLGFQAALTEATIWARLYGGAILVHLIDDGQDLETPLNQDRIRAVIGYRVYDRWEIYFTDNQFDSFSGNLLEADYYNIQPSFGAPFRVHKSRISLLDGRRLPIRERLRNNYWGASVLQGVFNYLTRVGESYGYAGNIMRAFVQDVISINGLTEALRMGDEALIGKHIEMIDVSKSIINSVLIDGETEQFTRTSSSVGGLSDLIDRFTEALAASTGVPITKLFGRSPAGMNATGSSDMRNYYDMLDAERKRYLSPILERVVRDIYRSKQGPTNGAEPENWSVKWASLWQPSDDETADIRQKVANTDAIYLDRGVISPGEVARDRFGEDGWSMETIVSQEPDLDLEMSDMGYGL